ncbi:EKA-like protein [Blumeria hordei DH14]|uniref:EKA-like protein n=1 Tax=Blumeria graminis f. sp. hordei (strain DH14) TaxID=546991 RepID=N1JB14_BLUG1|nr:EKA-like protein [Blumeria hordei DH14]
MEYGYSKPREEYASKTRTRVQSPEHERHRGCAPSEGERCPRSRNGGRRSRQVENPRRFNLGIIQSRRRRTSLSSTTATGRSQTLKRGRDNNQQGINCPRKCRRESSPVDNDRARTRCGSKNCGSVSKADTKEKYSEGNGSPGLRRGNKCLKTSATPGLDSRDG